MTQFIRKVIPGTALSFAVINNSMTLRDAISEALETDRSWDDDAVIYCGQPHACWTPKSLCRVVFDGNDASVVERDGQTWYYFLEVFLVRELFEDGDDLLAPEILRPLFGDDAPAILALPVTEAQVHRVIYYAAHDA